MATYAIRCAHVWHVVGQYRSARLAGGPRAPAAATPTFLELAWEARSDWQNVQTAGAKGDGVTDDTAAIQSVLNRLQDGVTIYFPPGTYRITKALEPPAGRFLGVTLLGHGRSTTLVWDGEAQGRMFWTHDGMTTACYIGLTWDGRGKAAVGVDHAGLKIFETEIRHRYEAYRNFTESGIRIGKDQHVATAKHSMTTAFSKIARTASRSTRSTISTTPLPAVSSTTVGWGFTPGRAPISTPAIAILRKAAWPISMRSTRNPPVPSAAAPHRDKSVSCGLRTGWRRSPSRTAGWTAGKILTARWC